MNIHLTHTVGQLDRLIRLCKEASYEFNLARDHVQDSDLRDALERAVARHAELAREFEDRVTTYDREGKVGLVPNPASERFWAEITPAAQTGDPAVLLSACERGERRLLAVFTEIVDDAELDAATRELVRRRAADVAAVHRDFKARSDRAAGR